MPVLTSPTTEAVLEQAYQSQGVRTPISDQERVARVRRGYTQPVVSRTARQVKQYTAPVQTGSAKSATADAETQKTGIFKKIGKGVAIGAIVSAGAGLLAKGVNALFSDEARARRQAKRAARKAERAGEVYTPPPTSEPQSVAGAFEDIAATYAAQYAPPAGGAADFSTAAYTPAQKGKTDIGALVKKYWWVGLILLFVLGGGMKGLKVGNSGSRRRRRRAPARPAARRTTRRRAPARRSAPARRRTTARRRR